jgi:spore coat protein H
MDNQKTWMISLLAGICILAQAGCTDSALAGILSEKASSTEVNALNDQDESHGSGVEPNYEVVFPDDVVNEITIKIHPDTWQIMMDDMTEHYGEQGTGDGGIGFGRIRPGDGATPMPLKRDGQPEEFPEDMRNPREMDFADRRGPMGGMEDDDKNPVWVSATIEFQGEIWEHVGIRFKGNSSLRSTWSSGSLKMPLKLDFDQFEDDYPEIEDQRFYGFKQLSLSSNWSDNSYLREKVANDIFNEAGVAASETAFYAVTLDYGEGLVYLGLYTMVEVVDDTLIETKFSEDDGNVYKPSGSGASFADGSFNKASFDKETNQDEQDYSDILALFEALHANIRHTDPAAWREGLEAVFDVDTFLNWLAVNTVIQNWDTYGVMGHNYYLYNDPSTGQLTWIPWDNNMALSSKMGMSSVLPLDQQIVGDAWPLISFLMADEVYHQAYVDCVEVVINGAFEPGKMAETYQRLHDLIEPYVKLEEPQAVPVRIRQSSSTFESSVAELISHVNERYSAAVAFVASQR